MGERQTMLELAQLIKIQILDYSELSAVESTLLERACGVRNKAQAPYSSYWVGCSLTPVPYTDETLTLVYPDYFDGCNVENVNWSETGHAEENAIQATVSKLGPFRIRALAVCGAPAKTQVIWPPKQTVNLLKKASGKSVSDFCPSCGRCLQKIAENCFDAKGKFDPTVTLLGYQSGSGIIYRTTIGNAYPMPFLPQHLGINYANDPRLKR